MANKPQIQLIKGDVRNMYCVLWIKEMWDIRHTKVQGDAY